MGEGQEELFVPAPGRRVIVPAGRPNWWGVDPSTVRVAIGTVTPEVQRGWSTRSWPSVPILERLPLIGEETRALARELAVLLPPGIIFIEQPSGAIRNVELGAAYGVIAAAVSDGVKDALGTRSRMEVVVGSHWKLVACGSGSIVKAVPVPGAPRAKDGSVRKRNLPLEEYGVMKWARSVGYTGNSWDEADSGGMAECARRDVELVER